MVCEKRAEQTAPSFMPVIKPAVGGRVWEKEQRVRGGRRTAGSGVPPSGVRGAMQGETCFVLRLFLCALMG